jgi:hypothetical protein
LASLRSSFASFIARSRRGGGGGGFFAATAAPPTGRRSIRRSSAFAGSGLGGIATAAAGISAGAGAMLRGGIGGDRLTSTVEIEPVATSIISVAASPAALLVNVHEPTGKPPTLK